MPPSGRFVVGGLQQAWLRELGVGRIWLPSVPRTAPAARALPAVSTTTDGQDARSVREAAVAAVQTMQSGSTAVEPHAASAERSRAQAIAQAGVKRAVPPRAAQPGTDSGEKASVRQAPRTDLSTLSLTDLRQAVADCGACELGQRRRHAVFGMGVEQATWMVIGEAPGEQEDRQGLPFVGRSGQLLDAMLASVGHGRDKDVFIANVIKCRPPGNRNPRPDEIDACSGYLFRQIELIRPTAILILGRFAAQTLLRSQEPVSRLRGKVHQIDVAGTRIPAVVSYHPAYLLRSPQEKLRSWEDLQRLAAISASRT
ncbi:uracil-DNA glycosylase [Corticimicrobacter populi]|uniref:Type-4 uracil-DNA glycosylase n=2 Tax=Corticimicrobacter populi TaxID=2175229 RepID=A0A2V1K676_9BURK|nr:uracil-DNA glycosylase [Corticimicrobacter populi]PWF25189.1 uracil-DNA glycosylase [Corticimicrobacter populi]